MHTLVLSKTEEHYVKIFKLLFEFCNENNKKIDENRNRNWLLKALNGCN